MACTVVLTVPPPQRTVLLAAAVAIPPTVLGGLLDMFAPCFFEEGRKIGETAGMGTGVWAYYSLGAWRAYNTDAPVLT